MDDLENAMRAKYLGIESIIILRGSDVTLAGSVVLEGHLYSEPVYANIFCDYEELQKLLDLDHSDLGEKIKSEIQTQLILKDGDAVQIDLPDFLDNKLEWDFPGRVNLKPEINRDVPFQCYCLDFS